MLAFSCLLAFCTVVLYVITVIVRAALDKYYARYATYAQLLASCWVAAVLTLAWFVFTLLVNTGS
jgi:hypothetical protein